jgi:hypothetical protein
MRLLRFLLLLVPALVLVLLVRGWSGRKSGSQAPRMAVARLNIELHHGRAQNMPGVVQRDGDAAA